MSEHITAASVVSTLGTLTKELQDIVNQLKAADLDASKKRLAADIAESREFVKTEGPMDIRRHQAKIATEHLEDAALVAEALVRHLKLRVRELETRIDVGRTFGATVRAELKTIGYEGTP